MFNFSMKFLRWVTITAFLIGVFSGSVALNSGATPQPPIEWSHIPFLFFGMIFSVMFVIGLQLFRKDSKSSLFASYFVTPISFWLVASGLSAAFLGIFRGSVAPYAFLFLAMGVGALLALWMCWLLFHRLQNRA